MYTKYNKLFPYPVQQLRTDLLHSLYRTCNSVYYRADTQAYCLYFEIKLPTYSLSLLYAISCKNGNCLLLCIHSIVLYYVKCVEYSTSDCNISIQMNRCLLYFIRQTQIQSISTEAFYRLCIQINICLNFFVSIHHPHSFYPLKYLFL